MSRRYTDYDEAIASAVYTADRMRRPMEVVMVKEFGKKGYNVRIISAADPVRGETVQPGTPLTAAQKKYSFTHLDPVKRNGALKRGRVKRNPADAKEVAATILQQMGGWGKISVMLGKPSLAYSNSPQGPYLSMRFKSPHRGPNHVKITLTPRDTYTVEFSKLHGYSVKPAGTYTDVYAEQLKPLFEKVTGLYLSLGRARNSSDSFAGTGWDANRAWIKSALASAPVRVTPARAKEVIAQAKAKARFGPWSDQLDRVLSKGEYKFIHNLWGTRAGNTSFTDALEGIVRGPSTKRGARAKRNSSHAGHFALIDGKVLGDAPYVSAAGRVPGVSLDHIGMGEFRASTPHGAVDFARLTGDHFPGQVGRAHEVYGPGAAWLHAQMVKAKLAVKVKQATGKKAAKAKATKHPVHKPGVSYKEAGEALAYRRWHDKKNGGRR